MGGRRSVVVAVIWVTAAARRILAKLADRYMEALMGAAEFWSITSITSIMSGGF